MESTPPLKKNALKKKTEEVEFGSKEEEHPERSEAERELECWSVSRHAAQIYNEAVHVHVG